MPPLTADYEMGYKDGFEKAEARAKELEAKITKTLDRLDHSSLHDHADISSARAWLRDALQQKAPTPW